MSLYWLVFASLTVIGSLAYNVGVKSGSTSVNAFGFAFLLSFIAVLIQAVCCVIVKYGFNIDVTQGFNSHTVKYAALAGAAAALIDTSYFFAVRYGSVIASQIFWTIGGIIALTIFAVLFFGETLTPTKALGIAFGIIAVLLITRQP